MKRSSRSCSKWSILGLAVMLVLPACSNPRTSSDQVAPGPDAWSDADRAAAEHALNLMSKERTVTADLSDPKVARFLKRHYEIAGMTAERYPGLHDLMEEHARVHAEEGVIGPREEEVGEDLLYQDLATLMLALYPTASTAYNGHAAASFADAAEDSAHNLQLSYMGLCFYDSQNQPIGTCSSQSSFGSGQYFPVTNSVTTSDQSFSGVFSATYYDTTTKRYVAQMSSLELNTIDYPQMQSITDPVIIHSQNNSLEEALVCTSRSVNANANPGVCDYGNYAQTGVLVDMGGSVTYQQSQQPKTSNGVLVGTGSVSLINTHDGGQCTLSPSISGSNFFSQPQVSYNASTKTVQWDFDNLDFGSAQSLICGTDGTAIQFSLVLQVENDAAADSTIVASQTSAPGTVTPHLVGTNAGAMATPMLALVAGCLHPDTEITMADGSARAIAELTGEGELVRTIGGAETHVVGTVDGDEATLFRITADDGTEILASALHPFVTATGDWVAADSLAAGDRVLGADGPRTIASVDEVEHDGPVHNLILDRSASALPDDTGTFYADGFLVGGHDAQQALAQARKADPERVRGLLPERFAVDYQSHLEEGGER